VTSSRGSYGLPSPFSCSSNINNNVVNYPPPPSMKPVTAAAPRSGSVDIASPSSASAANQPLLSPLNAKDECSVFAAKQLSSVGDRQVN